jgi:RNA polymerase sigma-70 factor (ECF subfamily)
MESIPAAAQAFAAARGVPVTPTLTTALASALTRAGTRWPTLAVDAPDFARFCAARLDEPALAGACVEDLLLAWACLRGQPGALAGFEEILAQVPAWVRKPAGAPVVDELKQRLRTQLLVGPEAQLQGYQGRGALHAWLRVSALRLLWKMEAGEARAQPLDEGQAPEDGARARRLDPERALAGEHAAPAVGEAMRAAFAGLTSKQRALLRLRHTGGLTDEKIGQMYGVHQSTATRWIAAAHEAVAASVRRQLEQRLRLAGAELDSVLADVQSRLDVSLTALLRTQSGGPGDAGDGQ